MKNMPASNLYEWLGLAHEGMQAMLRMSGVSECYITGGASDFEKLQALMDVLPLWQGHPYRRGLDEAMQKAWGVSFPHDVHQLAQVWLEVAEVLARGSVAPSLWLDEVAQPPIPAVQVSWDISLPKANLTASVSPYHPQFVRPVRASQPMAVMAELEEAWREVADLHPQLWVDVRGVSKFERPHPHPAGQAYMALCAGEEVSPKGMACLLFQLLRGLGQYSVACGKTLYLYGITPEVYTPLMAYLATCGGDGDICCVTPDPYHAVALAIAGAGVMLTMGSDVTREQVGDILGVVSCRMPVGRLVGVYVPDEARERVTQWIEEAIGKGWR